MAYNANGKLAQFMIFFIRQRLRGSYNDRLTGMDPQRIEIFHITNRNTVIEPVAHHLIFHLFPSSQRFFYQHLRRESKSFFHKYIQFLFIVAETGTESAKSVGGTDNHRIT